MTPDWQLAEWWCAEGPWAKWHSTECRQIGNEENDIEQNDIEQNDIEQNDIQQNDIQQNDIEQNDFEQNVIEQNDIKKNNISRMTLSWFVINRMTFLSLNQDSILLSVIRPSALLLNALAPFSSQLNVSVLCQKGHFISTLPYLNLPQGHHNT